MIECGCLTKEEIFICINYLLCSHIHSRNNYIRKFKSFVKQYKIKLKRISSKHLGYDKQFIWEDFFCNSDNLKKIMQARHITDIDYLLFRAWDYYNQHYPHIMLCYLSRDSDDDNLEIN